MVPIRPSGDGGGIVIVDILEAANSLDDVAATLAKRCMEALG